MRNVGYASIAVLLSMGLAGCGGDNSTATEGTTLERSGSSRVEAIGVFNQAALPTAPTAGFGLKNVLRDDGLMPFAGVLIANAISQTERAMALTQAGEPVLRAAQARFADFKPEELGRRFVPCDDSVSVLKQEVIFDQTDPVVTEKSLVKIGEVDPASETSTAQGDQSVTFFTNGCKQGDVLVNGATGSEFLEIAETAGAGEDATRRIDDLVVKINNRDLKVTPAGNAEDTLSAEVRGTVLSTYRRERDIVLATEPDESNDVAFSDTLFARSMTPEASTGNKFMRYVEDDGENQIRSAIAFDLFSSQVAGSGFTEFLTNGAAVFSTDSSGRKISLDGSGDAPVSGGPSSPFPSTVEINNLTYAFDLIASELDEVENKPDYNKIKEGTVTATVLENSTFVSSGAQGIINEGVVQYSFDDAFVKVVFNEASVSSGQISQVLDLEISFKNADGEASGDPAECTVQRADLVTSAIYTTAECIPKGLSERLLGIFDSNFGNDDFNSNTEDPGGFGFTLAGGASQLDQVFLNNICEMDPTGGNCTGLDSTLAAALEMAQAAPATIEEGCAERFSEEDCAIISESLSGVNPDDAPDMSELDVLSGIGSLENEMTCSLRGGDLAEDANGVMTCTVTQESCEAAGGMFYGDGDFGICDTQNVAQGVGELLGQIDGE